MDADSKHAQTRHHSAHGHDGVMDREVRQACGMELRWRGSEGGGGASRQIDCGAGDTSRAGIVMRRGEGSARGTPDRWATDNEERPQRGAPSAYVEQQQPI